MRRAVQRLLRVRLALLLWLSCWSSSVMAAEEPQRQRYRLEWQVPRDRGCVGPAAFAANVEAGLKDSVFEVDASARVLVELKETSEGWTLALRVFDETGVVVAERLLTSRDIECGAVLDGAALALLLMLDGGPSPPVAGGSPANAPPPTSTNPSDAATVSLPVASPGQNATTPLDEKASQKSDSPPPPPPPPPPDALAAAVPPPTESTTAAAEEAPAEPAEPADRSSEADEVVPLASESEPSAPPLAAGETVFEAYAEALGQLGVLPNFVLGVELGAATMFPSGWGAAVGVGLSQTSTSSSSVEGMPLELDMWLWRVHALFQRRVYSERDYQHRLAASVHAGQIRTSVRGARDGPDGGGVAYVAWGARSESRFRLGDSWTMAVSVEAVLPVLKDKFQEVGGDTIARLPPVGGLVGLGLSSAW